MRFSLGLTPYDRYPDLGALTRTVQLAESLGFEGVSIGDHIVIPKSHQRTISPYQYDSLILGMTIAAATTRLRLLFNVFVLPYRHPVALAKAIATLDVLSGGRVTVGAGVGWIPGEFEALGVPYRDRGRRTDEYLLAMKHLWTLDEPSFSGRFVSFRDILFEPKPLQKPHPPIWVGGTVPASRERAARMGNGFHPMGRTPRQLGTDVTEVRRLLADHGRGDEEFTFSYTVYHGDVAGQTARHTKMAGGGDPTVLHGDPGAALEALESFRQMGFTHLTVRVRGLTEDRVAEGVYRFAESVISKVGR